MSDIQRASLITSLKSLKPQELNMNVQVRGNPAINATKTQPVDMKLEGVVIPVSAVERAKQFYANLG